MKSELPKPPAIEMAERAMELVRIWIVDGNQQIVLSPNLWRDPGAWGLMLVDLARHVSRAYASKGFDEEVVLSKIKEALEAEWQHPTE